MNKFSSFLVPSPGGHESIYPIVICRSKPVVRRQGRGMLKQEMHMSCCMVQVTKQFCHLKDTFVHKWLRIVKALGHALPPNCLVDRRNTQLLIPHINWLSFVRNEQWSAISAVIFSTQVTVETIESFIENPSDTSLFTVNKIWINILWILTLFIVCCSIYAVSLQHLYITTCIQIKLQGSIEANIPLAKRWWGVLYLQNSIYSEIWQLINSRNISRMRSVAQEEKIQWKTEGNKGYTH